MAMRFGYLSAKQFQEPLCEFQRIVNARGERGPGGRRFTSHLSQLSRVR